MDYRTGAAGDYENTDSWRDSGGGAVTTIPGDGDRVIDWSHGIVQNTNRMLGTSPAASDGTSDAALAFLMQQGGSWTINPGVEMLLRGPGRVNNTASSTANLDAIIVDGGRLAFDATQAASPSTANYAIRLGNNNWNYRRLVGKNGAVIESVAGAAPGYLNGVAGTDVDCSGYTLLRRLGTASIPAMLISQGVANSAHRFSMVDVEIDTCGQLGNGGTYPSGSGTFLLRRVSMHNTLHATYALNFVNAPASGIIDDCDFDKRVRLVAYNGVVQGGCSFRQGFELAGTGLVWLGDDLFVVVPNGAIEPPAGVTSHRIYRAIARDANNVKAQGYNPGAGINITDEDTIFDPLGASTSSGENYAGNSLAASCTRTSRRPIMLPHHDGTANYWSEILDNVLNTHHIEHATGAAHPASVDFGHNLNADSRADGRTDGIDRVRVKSSVFIGEAGSGANLSKVGQLTHATVQPIEPLECDYNASYSENGGGTWAAGSLGKRYSINRVGGNTDLPGANDIDDVPMQRVGAPGGGLARLSTWGRDMLGLTGTTAQIEDAAMAALAARHLLAGRYGRVANHSDYRAGATVQALHAFVTRGAAPQAIAYRYMASHDGAVTRGAAAFAPARNRRRRLAAR